MGYFTRAARLEVTEASISETSPEMRAMMSPLRSLVKNPMGRVRILAYIASRMSRTTPLRSGMMKKSLR